jgi:hypothetical protein
MPAANAASMFGEMPVVIRRDHRKQVGAHSRFEVFSYERCGVGLDAVLWVGHGVRGRVPGDGGSTRRSLAWFGSPPTSSGARGSLSAWRRLPDPSDVNRRLVGERESTPGLIDLRCAGAVSLRDEPRLGRPKQRGFGRPIPHAMSTATRGVGRRIRRPSSRRDPGRNAAKLTQGAPFAG